MKVFMFAKKFILKYWGKLFVFIMISFLAWCLSIILPYITGLYIDALVKTTDISFVTKFTLLILITGILSIVFSYVQGYLHVKIQTKAMMDLNFYLLNHLVRMPSRYFENKDSGYLNHRINNDSSVVISFVLYHIFGIIINALTIIVLLYICLNFNSEITLILLPLIPLYMMLYFVFRKPLYEKNYHFKEEQN
ncbi:MAG: ABC transporter transmembrane domain-containing protein, partial [Alkaliphilus sp.]